MKNRIFAIAIGLLCSIALSQCGGSDSGTGKPFAGACTIADDVDGDGVADFLTTLTYDEQDRLVARAIDGSTDSIAAFAYGADGKLEGIDFDLNGDGDFDFEDIAPGQNSAAAPISVTHDAHGQEVRSFEFRWGRAGGCACHASIRHVRQQGA